MTDKDQLQGHDPAREDELNAKPAKDEKKDEPKPKPEPPKETPKSKE